MSSRTAGRLALIGILALAPRVAWALDIEPLVPGGYFAGDRAAGPSARQAEPRASDLDPFPFFSLPNERSIGLQAGSHAGSSATQRYRISPYGDSDAAGLAFFTPRFAGLQGGVGYRPDSLDRNEATELSLNWALDLSPGSRITASGSYALNRKGYDIGAGYLLGPLELQVTYGSSEGETEYEEIESLALTAGYAVGHGISLTGALGAAGRSDAAEINDRVDDSENDDFWVVTGFRIQF